MKRPLFSIVSLLLAWFIALHPSVADDVRPPSPELHKAFMSAVELFGKLAKQRANTGLPMRVFTDQELPEVQQRCDAIIAAAGTREDIIKAARFTVTAASYAARHPFAAGGPLEIPDDKAGIKAVSFQASDPSP
jgi:hypothetical protein